MAEAKAPKAESNGSLAAKLALARKKASTVEKKGRNTQQNYDYVKAEDVLREAESAMEEAGLVVVPSIESVIETHLETSNGNNALMVQTQLIYRIIDAESGEYLERPWIGYGYDAPGDKAIYKAITGAGKYFLAGLLGIPFGDDPEKDEHQPATRSKGSKGFAVKPDGTSPQRELFERLLTQKGGVTQGNAALIAAYANANFEGGRNGAISRAIDKLKDGDAKDAAEKLTKLANAWSAEQTDAPADDEGLPPLTDEQKATIGGAE